MGDLRMMGDLPGPGPKPSGDPHYRPMIRPAARKSAWSRRRDRWRLRLKYLRLKRWR